jgi:hypothetical protein
LSTTWAICEKEKRSIQCTIGTQDNRGSLDTVHGFVYGFHASKTTHPRSEEVTNSKMVLAPEKSTVGCRFDSKLESNVASLERTDTPR